MQQGVLLPHAVLLEPRLQPFPPVLCLLLSIARPIVGVEAVRRIRIDDDLRRAPRRLQRRPHLLDRVERDALVVPAVSLLLGGTVPASAQMLAPEPDPVAGINADIVKGGQIAVGDPVEDLGPC